MTTRAIKAWNGFWFEPVATSTLALTRIAFAAVVLFWAGSLVPELGPLFAQSGVVAEQPHRAAGEWGLLAVWPSDVAVAALLVALVCATIALAAGYRSRLSAIVVFVALMSFERRNPFVFNSGDVLLRTTAFFLALAPTGASFSVDAVRRGGIAALARFPLRAPWALRLVQVQLSMLYLAAVWAKLRGPAWNDGTAVGAALQLDDLARFPVPDAIVESPLVVNLLTYGTVAVEAAVGILIWNRAARPYVIAAALALHLGIDYSLRVGFFGLALAVSYVAFIPPDAASRWLTRAVMSARRHDEKRWMTRR